MGEQIIKPENNDHLYFINLYQLLFTVKILVSVLTLYVIISIIIFFFF
jgi:hypothetical protein